MDERRVNDRCRRRSGLGVAAVVAILLAFVGCSSGGGSDAKAGSSDTGVTLIAPATASGGGPSTTGAGGDQATRTLSILVTNDDGYDAPGIDNLVKNLQKLDKVKITVVAPATNQSGQGGKTTPGPLTHTDATTASGFPATSVQGFPADSVRYALDDLGLKPDLVVAGVNLGQNVGPVIDVSGTVGAARAAAAKGIPAIASSAGTGDPVDFQSVSDAVVSWIKDHRGDLGAKKPPATVVNINGPSCGTTGKIRGTVDVPPATTAEGAVGPQDCSSSVTNPRTDVEALDAGYLVVDTIPARPAG